MSVKASVKANIGIGHDRCTRLILIAPMAIIGYLTVWLVDYLVMNRTHYYTKALLRHRVSLVAVEYQTVKVALRRRVRL